MEYSALKSKVEALEQSWFGKLQASGHSHPTHSMANGEVQFFSVENKYPESDLDLPVVVGVGINYGQGVPKGPATYPVHHLSAHKSPPCKPPPFVVEDNAKGMRAATDATLDAYCFAPQTWVTNNYASRLGLWPSPNGVPMNYDYHLVATNFSPFLSLERWLKHTRNDQASLRSAWRGTLHLDDLYQLLVPQVDTLWIGHGKEAVWSDFRKWQNALGVSRWLLTHNLNPQTISMVRPFWMRP